jgi:hypothetical protein
MILDVGSAAVTASATTEAGIAAGLQAAAAACSAVITTVLPMGADLDSAQFAAALNAAGASFLGAMSEHAIVRTEFASTQGLAAATYTAADVISNAALSL